MACPPPQRVRSLAGKYIWIVANLSFLPNDRPPGPMGIEGGGAKGGVVLSVLVPGRVLGAGVLRCGRPPGIGSGAVGATIFKIYKFKIRL